MAANLHDEGELLVLDAALSARDMDVGLFDDSTDTLTDSATYASISTEPAGASYAVQTAAGGTTSQDANGNTDIDLGALTFDVSDSTAVIDAVYIRDTTSGDLIFTNALDSSYDLSNIDTLDLSNIGMSLD